MLSSNLIGRSPFSHDAHQFLGRRRHIPQPDGTKKVCPKVKDGNHAPCATCPHKGEFEREDKSMVSIETLNEDEYHPMQAAPSAETEALEEAIFEDFHYFSCDGAGRDAA